MFLKSLVILFLLVNHSDDVSTQVNGFFKDALKDYDNFKVEVINLPEDITSINFLSGTFPKNKSIISLPAEVKMKNGEWLKTILSFRLHLYKNALYAVSFVERKSGLKPEYFSFKLVEVNNTNGIPVYSFDEINNAVSKKNIFPGELLVKEFIEKAPVVKSGEKVIASIVSGSTVISFDAITKQDGRENDVIRIAALNKKQYKAKVIDSKNVSIIE